MSSCEWSTCGAERRGGGEREAQSARDGLSRVDQNASGEGRPASPAKRKATGEELLNRAKVAANRIQAGIDLLADPQCLDAFRIANKCMADAARQRQGVMQQKPVEKLTRPGVRFSWRSS